MNPADTTALGRPYPVELVVFDAVDGVVSRKASNLCRGKALNSVYAKVMMNASRSTRRTMDRLPMRVAGSWPDARRRCIERREM